MLPTIQGISTIAVLSKFSIAPSFGIINKNLSPGSIILMHDNHEYALKALDKIIVNLKNQGYKFVTVSELLELKKLRESE